MDKVLFIVNPNSGQKNGLEFVQKLQASFDQKNMLTHTYETTGNDDFKTLTKEALQKNIYTVLVLGGDGTISEYVNQIADLDIRPKIILVPLGTTNNLARALLTELDEDKLFRKLESFKLTEKQIDVGKMNERYFISTVSVGSIPEIAWKAEDDIKEKFGPFGYIIQGLDTLANQESFDVSMVIDGKEEDYSDVFLLVIGLSNSIFGIPTFFSEAAIDDGKLHLFILKNDSLFNEVSSITQQILNDENRPIESNNEGSNIYTTSFQEGIMNSDSNFNFAVDGEKGPSFPTNFSVFHKHLTFLVPVEEK